MEEVSLCHIDNLGVIFLDYFTEIATGCRNISSIGFMLETLLS